MNLAGNPVVLRLSGKGYEALGNILPAGGSFTRFVVHEDEHGLWITLQEEGAAEQLPTPVMLLKWEFLSTVVVNFAPEQPMTRERIGLV